VKQAAVQEGFEAVVEVVYFARSLARRAAIVAYRSLPAVMPSSSKRCHNSQVQSERLPRFCAAGV
jgi:hypothetical protein